MMQHNNNVCNYTATRSLYGILIVYLFTSINTKYTHILSCITYYNIVGNM